MGIQLEKDLGSRLGAKTCNALDSRVGTKIGAECGSRLGIKIVELKSRLVIALGTRIEAELGTTIRLGTKLGSMDSRRRGSNLYKLGARTQTALDSLLGPQLVKQICFIPEFRFWDRDKCMAWRQGRW